MHGKLGKFPALRRRCESVIIMQWEDFKAALAKPDANNALSPDILANCYTAADGGRGRVGRGVACQRRQSITELIVRIKRDCANIKKGFQKKKNIQMPETNQTKCDNEQFTCIMPACGFAIAHKKFNTTMRPHRNTRISV